MPFVVDGLNSENEVVDRHSLDEIFPDISNDYFTFPRGRVMTRASSNTAAFPLPSSLNTWSERFGGGFLHIDFGGRRPGYSRGHIHNFAIPKKSAGSASSRHPQ